MEIRQPWASPLLAAVEVAERTGQGLGFLVVQVVVAALEPEPARWPVVPVLPVRATTVELVIGVPPSRLLLAVAVVGHLLPE